MRQVERLRAEAEVRGRDLAARFPPDRCLGCELADPAKVHACRFHWSRSVRTFRTSVKITQDSVHALCEDCFAALHARRRWFWLVRALGGFGFGAALCGIVTCPVLLATLHMNAQERLEAISVGTAAVVLHPVSLLVLRYARWLSVPPKLFALTARAWECFGVTKIPGPRAAFPVVLPASDSK
jgi:hypothetical protein